MNKRQENRQEIIIRPLNIRQVLDFNLFAYSHLIINLVRKNIRVANDSTYLAFVWASSRPLAMCLIFATLRDLTNANMHVTTPYLVYLYSGYILWFYFMMAVTGSASSLVRESGIIKKIYFPRLIVPLVPCLAHLHDFFLSCIPLLFLCTYQKVVPGINILLFPVVLFSCTLISFALGTLVASIGLDSKDPQKLLNVILQLGMFVSPVIFSPGMIPHNAQIIYKINPMVGILMGFRATIDGDTPFPFFEFGYSLLFTIVLLAIALLAYAKAETSIADKL